MTMLANRRSFLVLAGVLTLAACGENWATSYDPIPQAASHYRVTRVDVTVPRTLTVSETELVFVPHADIVWKGEPEGDRYEQVKAIFQAGAEQGVRGMRGKEAVVLNITVEKFHALNNRARYYAPNGTGVYNIGFSASLTDAKTGKVVVPAQHIDADFAAHTGSAARQEEAAGVTQKALNIAQIRKTIAGWLGVGPDDRQNFNRIGG